MRRPAVRRAAAVLAALLGCGMLLAACGIPTEATARTIPASQVPFELLSPVNPSTSGSKPGPVQVEVYFTSTGDRVVPEPGYVAPPADLAAVISVLLKGPSITEERAGLQTGLGIDVRLLRSSVSSDVVTLDFDTAFGQISGPQEVLAVAQVVFTVVSKLASTQVGVLFEIDGAPIDVPTSTGALVPGPVHESEYATLLAPAAS